jgi:hypothetical protein
MSTRIILSVIALAAGLAACDRAAPTAANEESATAPLVTSPEAGRSAQRSAMDRLARRFARALADPSFRATLKAELDQSRVVEHKLQLQSFLRKSDRRVLKEVARLSAAPVSEVEADLNQVIPLEIYFPVPSHWATWSGGSEVLVASALEDHETPVAFDGSGRRQVLSADHPPSTPVLAMVPVETDFAHPYGSGSTATCTTLCGGGGGGEGTTQPHGLFMTYAHFVQDFEGWFKGSPEFEIHILGQSGATDSLKDYQCAGEPAGGYYRFDQNGLDWSGSVLLFSQAQLDGYKAAHPNQNFRIVALEDDDTGCVIKFDSNRFKNMLSTIQTQYPNLTGTKDTTNALAGKIVKRANALQKILSAVYSFITTQDDQIGNAIEDVVVGQTYPGANWIVKGENNVTNGWVKLEMR